MIGVSMTKWFIILVALAGLVSAGCDDNASASGSANSARGNDREDNKERKARDGGKGRTRFKLGRIQHKDIAESSGVAASRKHPGVVWTHNDSGDAPRVFALDAHTCATIATYTIPGATAVDWEDMARGPDETGRSSLWFGDIGDAVVLGGNVPMDVLALNIDDYIARTKAA